MPATMRVDGEPVHFRSTRDALAAGIGMVHQELSVVPELTVAENVFLGAQPVEPAGRRSPGGGWRARRRSSSTNLGLDIDPRARLGD